MNEASTKKLFDDFPMLYRDRHESSMQYARQGVCMKQYVSQKTQTPSNSPLSGGGPVQLLP